MEMNEIIAEVVELINQEPRYYAELIRIMMAEHGYSWSYWSEKIAKALWILLTEGKIEKRQFTNGELITSTIWQPYSFYFPSDEPPIGWDEYIKRADKKLRRIGRLAEIGLKNAEMFEKLVYEVVKEIYPDAKKTDFKSPLPDIFVPSQNIIVEATTRFEFPITKNYIEWKYYHLAKPFEYAYHLDRPLKMLIVGPIVSREAWKFVRKEQFEPGKGIYSAYAYRIPAVKIVQFPKTNKSHAGWPLFRKYAYYKRWLEELHRKVYVISYREAKRKLYQALLNAFRHWEIQEKVLISSKP